jgi:Carboxypeptidase regulatory-like domain
MVLAQTAGTGALRGTVTDQSGAVVPNATITATNPDTGQARTATTGADGTYTFSLLPPGNYKVKFEAPGFKPVEIPSAAVNVTETGVLDRSLEVGGQAQTVTVEGEVEVIQTASSALGTVANARTVSELPLNTRNYTNLLAMTAGSKFFSDQRHLCWKGLQPDPREWRRHGPKHISTRRRLHSELVQPGHRCGRRIDRYLCNPEPRFHFRIQNPDGDL